jgi:hypothetical protein
MPIFADMARIRNARQGGSPAAEDPRRATLIADVFADFERLLAESKHSPSTGDAGLAPSTADRGKEK